MFCPKSDTVTFHFCQYPGEAPEISVTNPRGLGDDQIESIISALRTTALQSVGSPILYALIEKGKELLTASNLPRGHCVICLYGFQEDDGLTKTQCFHHFHSYCLGRYVQHCLESSGREEPVECPVCREGLNFDFKKLQAAAPPQQPEELFVPDSLTLQRDKELRQVYERQRAKGGIIDLEAEKNRFFISIQETPASDHAAQQTHPASAEQTHPGAEQTHPGAEQTHPGTEQTHPASAEQTHPGAEQTHPGAEQTHPASAEQTHPGTEPRLDPDLPPFISKPQVDRWTHLCGNRPLSSHHPNGQQPWRSSRGWAARGRRRPGARRVWREDDHTTARGRAMIPAREDLELQADRLPGADQTDTGAEPRPGPDLPPLVFKPQVDGWTHRCGNRPLSSDHTNCQPWQGSRGWAARGRRRPGARRVCREDDDTTARGRAMVRNSNGTVLAPPGRTPDL
ncbi:E3 ubiquitin-protein ligase RNF25 isoform X2 [Hyla sarda]|uniref:E3 ubiquitin-protein ligase RNF25 isoform X2 n=1 Tax=Hyla sarda TaxID=327740 RepID=UPI0024C37387|nr:E3 ubiquitin-protein ligase RNF25 isoform X2 [Hyla sarda]